MYASFGSLYLTGRPADRQTGRPADRQTGRPADRQTGRPADRVADCEDLSALVQKRPLTLPPFNPLAYAVVLLMLIQPTFESPAQSAGADTLTVGVVFVDFPDITGGVGYDGSSPRQIDTSKYAATYWREFFFKEEGRIQHPDSTTHSDVWSGEYAPFHLGSLARWCRENSYGRHVLIPYSGNGRNGILNNINASHRIEWLRLSQNKHNYMYPYNPTIESETAVKLNTLYQGLPDPPLSVCDVLFIVHGGPAARYPGDTTKLMPSHWFRWGSPGVPPWAIIPEKTHSDIATNAILNFSMHGAIHEYIHAASEVLLEPSDIPNGYMTDYGYDVAARWMGFSAMYGHGVPNRPLHLDPWAKLMLGWIDYEILSEGDHHNVSLPIITQADGEDAPKVLIIPINVPWDYGSPQWYYGHYLIIENRRRGTDSFDQTLTDSSSVGGFLVWEYNQGLILSQRGGLTVVEADGRYDMKFTDRRFLGSQNPKLPAVQPVPSDLWNVPAVLSTWSDHLLGLLDTNSMKSDPCTPVLLRNIPRQVTIRFGSYDATGNENVIPYIGVGSPTSNTQIATKNNNQRKLIKHGDKLVFAATSDLSGDDQQGAVSVFESADNGASWTSFNLLSTVDIWRTPTTENPNPWAPKVNDCAAAPAIAQVENSWRVVWQRKLGNGISRLLIAGPTDSIGADITDLDIDRSDDEVTPVIAWGRVLPGTPDTTLLKVVWCTDSGLYQMRSSDGGATWLDSSAVHIAGTSSASINPSLAMSENHEVLVYEEQETIKLIIDGGAAIDLSAMHPEFLRNLTPSVSISGSIAHITWAAEQEEYITDPDLGLRKHIKPVHKVVNLDAGPDDNVASFINVKYGRLEAAQRPVIAAKYQESDPLPASIAWSVFDQTEGARLRYNEFSLSSTTNQFEWARKSYESSFSNTHTYHPAIAADQGDAKYIVTRGDESPYRIQLGSIPPLPADSKHLGDRETGISVLDVPSAQWQNRIIFKQPKQYDNIGQHIGTLEIGGVPAIGFDGSHDGPQISALTMTPKFLLQQDDIVTWEVQVSRLVGNIYNDTNGIRLDMYDPISQQTIGSTAMVLIPPDKQDSVVVFTMQLPPSHYPADSVQISIHIEGDAYDSGNRYYTAVHNILCDDPIAKSYRGEVRQSTQRPLPPSVEVFPQPAGNSMQVTVHEIPHSDVYIALYDKLGRRMLQRRALSSADGFVRLNLDVSGLQSGVYILRTVANGMTRGRTVSIVR